jgi:hypothetical protein
VVNRNVTRHRVQSIFSWESSPAKEDMIHATELGDKVEPKLDSDDKDKK